MSNVLHYRREVDGLRAVAVTSVVLFHAGIPGFSGGYVGVDVFFVISGFLITSIISREIAQNRFTLARFYERRARRILPALAGMLVLTWIAGLYFLGPKALASLGASTIATALFGSNILFWIETGNYFADSSELFPLLHTWSLAVEEQFYIVIPLIMMAIARFAGVRLFVPVFLAIVIVSFVFALVALPYRPNAVFFLPMSRAWELGLGSLLALMAAPELTRRSLASEIIGVLGLLGIAVPVVLYTGETPFPGLAAAPVCVGTALLIAVREHSAVTRVLGSRGFVWIGLLSYSWYLWHWPVLVYARVQYNTVHLPIMVGVACALLSLALAYASYRFVEQPFRHGGKDVASQQRALAAGGAALGVMICVGMALAISGGFPKRFSPTVQQIYAADDDNFFSSDCWPARKQPSIVCPVSEPTMQTARGDVILWGDSHAAALAPGVSRVMSDAGYTVSFTGLSACPPLPGIARNSTRFTECITYNSKALPAIVAAEADIVLLHARWTFNIVGEAENGEQLSLAKIGNGDERLTEEGNKTLTEQGLRAAIAAVQSGGSRAIILGPLPDWGVDIPRAAIAATRFGHDAHAGLDRSYTDRQMAETRAVLMTVAAETGAEYLDIYEPLCTDEHCAAIIDGKPLFRDMHHITGSGATYLAERFVPEILAAQDAERIP